MYYSMLAAGDRAYDAPRAGEAHRGGHLYYTSGGRLCALIGVPWRLRCFSTFSTFSNILI